MRRIDDRVPPRERGQPEKHFELTIEGLWLEGIQAPEGWTEDQVAAEIVRNPSPSPSNGQGPSPSEVHQLLIAGAATWRNSDNPLNLNRQRCLELPQPDADLSHEESIGRLTSAPFPRSGPLSCTFGVRSARCSGLTHP
jgi:hypothetical protein